MFDEQQQNLKPFIDAGTAVLPQLLPYEQQSQSDLTQALNAAKLQIPLNVSNESIQNMPGYQFNLQQGLKATQNSATNRGWGGGGEAAKAAANFSTGLSNNYYQNYFQNQQGIYSDMVQQFNNLYNQKNQGWNQLSYLPTLGENAAATSGYQSNQAGANIGSNIAGAGQASAAGTAAAGQALGGSLANAGSNIGSGLLTYSLMNQPQNNPNNSAYYGSNYNYNPVASGYNSDINSAGGQFLVNSGFVNPLYKGA
jgi:hypothetical protein